LAALFKRCKVFNAQLMGTVIVVTVAVAVAI
jgi:hypothetical protein